MPEPLNTVRRRGMYNGHRLEVHVVGSNLGPYRSSARPAPPRARVDPEAVLGRVWVGVTVLAGTGLVLVCWWTVLRAWSLLVPIGDRAVLYAFAVLGCVVGVLAMVTGATMVRSVWSRNRVAIERPVWTQEERQP